VFLSPDVDLLRLFESSRTRSCVSNFKPFHFQLVVRHTALKPGNIVLKDGPGRRPV
jgi:hypothetical protein